MQTVLHYFFSTFTFEECLVGVVNQGGDADTAAAIAGSIAGAYYGPAAIPRRWVRKLTPPLRSELARLSNSLFELSPYRQQAARQPALPPRQPAVRAFSPSPPSRPFPVSG
jgi:ADP-ribosyl-[dinitrogen reductase] hydrolase